MTTHLPKTHTLTACHRWQWLEILSHFASMAV